MLDNLIAIDQQILLAINGIHCYFLDIIMIFATMKFGWIPFYLYLLFLVYKKYDKRIWLVLIIVALTVTMSDQGSVHLFKNVFQRLRPCHNPEIASLLYTPMGCGGLYGFISGHASSSFAIATLMILLLKDKYRWIIPVMIVYAVLVSISRVYVAVHYPSDITAGAIFGVLIGIITFNLFKTINKRI